MRVSEIDLVTTSIEFSNIMKILAAKVDCKSSESVHIWGNYYTRANNTYGQESYRMYGQALVQPF